MIDQQLAIGLLAALCALWLLVRIERRKPPPEVLPAPRMDRIARGGRDAWEVGEARVRVS